MALFVSGKKYRKLQESLHESQSETLELKEELARTRFQTQVEIDRVKAINESLERFSEKFKEFYQKVTQVPVITRTSKEAITLTSSSFIDEMSSSYGHAVESMKGQMIYDLAKHLEKSGLVQFDLIDDPLEARMVYKATIRLIPPGGDVRGG